MTFEVYPWTRHLAKVALGDLAADLDSQLLQNTLLQEAILTGRCMEGEVEVTLQEQDALL